MADIAFAPICSNCGLPIYIDIDVNFEDLLYYELSRESTMLRRAQINPSACPNCGEHFESIKMPTRLPYEFPDDVKKIYNPMTSFINQMKKEAIVCEVDNTPITKS